MNIGDRVTSLTEYLTLPLGTILWDGSRDRYQYVVCEDGFRHHEQNTMHTLDQISNSSRIRSFGTIERPVRTLAEVHQRFYTISRGRARRSSVSLDPVDRAFRALGVPTTTALRDGMWVHPNDDATRDILPNGTLLLAGDATVDHRFTMVVWHRSDFTPILGAVRDTGDILYRVVKYPDGTTTLPWATHESDQETLINDFRRRAWEIGVRAKADAGWCGDFESAMFRAGIDRTVLSLPVPAASATAAAVTGLPGVGETVMDNDVVAQYPVGSAFGYSYSDAGSHWNVTIRVTEGGSPEARTEHLVGPNTGRQGGRNEVLWNGVGEPLMRVVDERQMRYMPHMTIARYTNRDRNNCWVKGEGDVWHANHNGGSRTSVEMLASASREHLRYSFIPGRVRGVDFGGDPTQYVEPAAATEVGLPTGVDYTTYDEQIAYPVGAVFRYPPANRTAGSDWCFMTRAPEGQGMGRANTTHLAGPNVGSHGSTGRVVFNGVGRPLIPVRDSAEMDAMPDGTTVEYVGSPVRHWFTKRGDQWLGSPAGSSVAPQRTSSQMVGAATAVATLNYTFIPSARTTSFSFGINPNEGVMEVATPAAVTHQVGEAISANQFRTMPIGSIVMGSDEDGADRRNFFVRCNRGGSGMDRLFTTREDGGSREGSRLTLVSVGNGSLDGTCDMVVPSTRALQQVPINTEMRQAEGDLHWRKTEADGWTRIGGSGGVNTSDFFTLRPDLRFTHIPMDRLNHRQSVLLTPPTAPAVGSNFDF